MGMEEAAEDSKESSHFARDNGMDKFLVSKPETSKTHHHPLVK